jgi:RNA polymerase subunit RPABC4/transcription elongation factor Spt4
MKELTTGAPQTCPTCGSDDLEIVISGNRADMVKMVGVDPTRKKAWRRHELRCRVCGRSAFRDSEG